MKRVMFYNRFKRFMDDVQSSNGKKEIFLRLLENAKQAASESIEENCPEFQKSWSEQIEIEKELKEKVGAELISEYSDKCEETNNIWSEEMYLRGIQDALCFFGILFEPSVESIINEKQSELVNDIEMVELPNHLKKYSDVIGIENLLKMSDVAGGSTIYIPKKECILKYFRKENIRREYDNGKSVKQIADEYGFSERTIYKYINEK